MGTDATTPKGDKSVSEGAVAISGAVKAAVRKLGQELGIPAAQLPLEDFSFLTKVYSMIARRCVAVGGAMDCDLEGGGRRGQRRQEGDTTHLYCVRLVRYSWRT